MGGHWEAWTAWMHTNHQLAIRDYPLHLSHAGYTLTLYPACVYIGLPLVFYVLRLILTRESFSYHKLVPFEWGVALITAAMLECLALRASALDALSRRWFGTEVVAFVFSFIIWGIIIAHYRATNRTGVEQDTPFATAYVSLACTLLMLFIVVGTFYGNFDEVARTLPIGPASG